MDVKKTGTKKVTYYAITGQGTVVADRHDGGSYRLTEVHVAEWDDDEGPDWTFRGYKQTQSGRDTERGRLSTVYPFQHVQTAIKQLIDWHEA